MSISPDDLRKTFDEWIADDRIFRVRIDLLQDGLNSLQAVVTDCSVTEAEVRFSFGFDKLAWGEVVIPFSTELSIEWMDDQKSGLPASERCMEFTWKLSPRDRERCVVCLQRKS